MSQTVRRKVRRVLAMGVQQSAGKPVEEALQILQVAIVGAQGLLGVSDELGSTVSTAQPLTVTDKELIRSVLEDKMERLREAGIGVYEASFKREVASIEQVLGKL